MAFRENRKRRFRIKFRFEGRQYSRSLKTTNEQKADLAKDQIEQNLELVSLGLLEAPDTQPFQSRLVSRLVSRTFLPSEFNGVIRLRFKIDNIGCTVIRWNGFSKGDLVGAQNSIEFAQYGTTSIRFK
jgi:hypothetical protein